MRAGLLLLVFLLTGVGVAADGGNPKSQVPNPKEIPSSKSQNVARRVWIDTDPAIGAPWREVDDAFALVLAFHSPEVRIVGISATNGNAGLKRTTQVARGLVRRFGASAGLKEEDVHAGANARDALARALEKGRLTYIALGPLTNLAHFLQWRPALASRIERVIFVGGRSPEYDLRFGRKGWLRIHDANVFKDSDAARWVVRSEIPIVLAPVESSLSLSLDRAEWNQLCDGGAAARFLHRKSRMWMWFWTSVVRERGAPVFDALAVLAAAQPGAIKTEVRYAAIDDKRNLIAHRKPVTGSRRVRFGTSLRGNAKQLLLDRLPH